jgi:diguanylate cyclase (GGDEF)-like protein
LMNQTARRWHGLDPDIEPSRDQLAQLAVDLFEADGVTPLAFATSPLMRALRHGRVWNSELVIVPANMPSTRVMVTGTALLGPAGEVVGAVATMHDLTLLKQRETELQEALTDIVNVEQRLADAALRDPLTGLPNRTLLADRLASTLSRTGRSGHQMAVLFCDLDGFKAVNTNGGHAAGDAMLQACAQRLLATLRAEDTAARVGGDEFVVVLEPSSRGWAGPDGAPIDVRSYALVVAERIEEALAEPVDFNGNRYAVTVSIGLTFAQAGDDVEEVLAQADRAMYEAKSLGKNRHQFYTDVRRVRAL